MLNMKRLESPELLARGLDALLASTGLRGRIVPESVPVGNLVADAIIDIDGLKLIAEVKRAIDRTSSVTAALDQLKRLDAELNVGGLVLITEYLSPEMLNTCRSVGLNAFDASGNAYIVGKGLFVFVTGVPRRLQSAERLGWNASAVRIGLVLLATPEVLSGTYRKIVLSAGVALGSVGPSLQWFKDKGFLIERGDVLVASRRKELLTQWTVAYASRLQPRLESQRFSTSSSTLRGWWKSADIAPGVWSGEVGATLSIGSLKPASYQLYVDEKDRKAVVRRLVKEHRLVPDESGSIEMIEKFWDFRYHEQTRIAPMPVIYADLRNIADPRTDEIAELIKAQFVDY